MNLKEGFFGSGCLLASPTWSSHMLDFYYFLEQKRIQHNFRNVEINIEDKIYLNDIKKKFLETAYVAYSITNKWICRFSQ